jgi:hypothetical protein
MGVGKPDCVRTCVFEGRLFVIAGLPDDVNRLLSFVALAGLRRSLLLG